MSSMAPSVDRLIDLGAHLLYTGRPAMAEALLLRAAAAQAAPAAFRLLAHALMVQERAPEALRVLAAGLAANPRDASLHFRLARVHEGLGASAAARAGFERFLELASDAPGARFEAFMALDRFAKAFREAERMLDAWSADEADRLNAPWEDELFHRRSAAFHRERLARLSAFGGKRASPWPGFFRGLLKLELGLAREAQEEFARLRRFPAHRYGWMRYAAGIAFFSESKERCADAAAEFESVLRYKPDAFWARGRLAEALLCLGREKEAFAEFGRAEAALDGPKAKAHLRAWRGEALLWLGRYDEALGPLDLAVSSGAELAYCWRGGARLLLGDHAGAGADLDAAVGLDPGDAEARLWRGELYRRMGRLDEARAELTRAASLDAGPMTAVNLALAESPRGKTARELESRLRAARGVRRPEPYLEALHARR